MQNGLSVFISYSHKDRELFEELNTHLSSLRPKFISSWYDGDIDAGTEWEVEILEHLKSAQIILLLISADFIHSDFCISIEMKEAIARHNAKEACVIPILLRPTYWKDAPFAKLKMLPTDAKPVTSWTTHDDAFENIVRGIRSVVETYIAKKEQLRKAEEDRLTLLAKQAEQARLEEEKRREKAEELEKTHVVLTADHPSEATIPKPTHSSVQIPLPTITPLTSWKISRRIVITSLITVMGGSAVGSITWWELSHGLFNHTITPTPNLISRSVGTPLYAYRRHSNNVDAVAWSPDGKRIASGSWDKTVQVWNAADGSNVFTYHGHSNNVDAVAWSPDGKRIASGSWDKTVQVWNAADGSNVFTYHGDANVQYVYAIAWSPDGKHLASGNQYGTVQVWNTTDGSNVFTYHGHSNSVHAVAWSPDGKRIASASFDKTVQVWNMTDGSNVLTYSGHSNNVDAVAWAPDGKRIASGSWDKTVQVWNATDGSNVFTYSGHSNNVDAVAWAPDGKRIASGSRDKTVQVWNATDGSNVFTYSGHSSTVNAVEWAPDGKRIASGGDDNTVQVWSAS